MQEGQSRRWPGWVLLLSAIVALSTALPHAWQALTCPPDEVFTGFVEAQNDQNLYMVWLQQAREGRVLMDNLATPEQAPPIFVGPHWVALGMLARVIPIPLIVLYRIVAVALAFAYLLILWRLVSELFAREHARLFAFVIGALGSGFGVICDAINTAAGRVVIVSADLMPELWAYHSFLLPHFTLALCSMALLTLTLLRAWRAPSLRLGVAAAGWAFLLTAVHPYDLAVWGPLLMLHLAAGLATGVPWRTLSVNLWALGGAFVPTAVYALLARSHPMLAVWAEQNVLRSPAPLVYLIGTGAILPLAIFGFRSLREEGDAPDQRRLQSVFLGLWPAVTALIAYSYPLVPFERRAVEGVHIPLGLLAATTIAVRIVPWLRQRLAEPDAPARRVALILLLFAILPTNLALLVYGARTEEARLPLGMVRGFEWIAANTPPDARIFAGMYVGQHLMRYAMRHVFAGQLQTTINPDARRALAWEFFAEGTDNARRREILRESGCGWVAADREQARALEGLTWLEEAHDAGELRIFRFPGAGPPPVLGAD